MPCKVHAVFNIINGNNQQLAIFNTCRTQIFDFGDIGIQKMVSILFNKVGIGLVAIYHAEYRNALVKQMSGKVQELPRDNFAVRQHLRYVEKYSAETGYQCLTYEDTRIVRDEVAPLIQPDDDEASAVRFDALLYRLELAYLLGKRITGPAAI